MRNLYVRELRRAECAFYNSLYTDLIESDMAYRSRAHYWWSRISKLFGAKHHDLVPPQQTDGQRFSFSAEKASCLNSFFAKQCSVPKFDLTPVLHQQSSVFSFSEISSEEVSCALKRLNDWKASALDELSPVTLGVCRRDSPYSIPYLQSVSCERRFSV